MDDEMESGFMYAAGCYRDNVKFAGSGFLVQA